VSQREKNQGGKRKGKKKTSFFDRITRKRGRMRARSKERDVGKEKVKDGNEYGRKESHRKQSNNYGLIVLKGKKRLGGMPRLKKKKGKAEKKGKGERGRRIKMNPYRK